ncbi:TPA_asm: nucleoprotein [Nomada lathburiana mononega-like virus]|uniref:Nucleoprotein n=2 Tax=Jingchuvirales TaxID=2499407 RepID=A0A7T0Q5D7_9VIRU|nr:nucleoprotein [Nomada lathburiana mononega-like virus]QPL15324.1 nucleoprotein [Hymenopteran chu-related virus OKIAV124]DAZ89737.1 TPA_asm: nucleoprotein [Nomada lathburiana mononega-like virus]
MANRGTLSERIVQARNKGVPSIVANFSQLMSTSVDAFSPLTLIATGDVLNDEHRGLVPAFITWGARPLIAEVTAQSWATAHGAQDADQVLARTYGELTGINIVRNQNAVDHVVRSRERIMRILRQRCPPVMEIRSLVTDIITKCRNQDDAWADPEDIAAYINHPVNASNQTVTFYKYRGHLVDANIFSNEDSRVKWIQLNRLNNHLVDLEEFDFAIEDNLIELWRGLERDTVLGFYEAKAMQGVEKTRSMMGGAIFSYLATLAKVSNITPAWVQRRKKQFEDRLPGVNFDGYISEPVLKHYARMYTQVDAQWEDIYRQLVVCWSMLQSAEGASLAWIIEQASNNNVTCVMTIADVITRLQFFDIDLVLAKGIPRTNFSYAAIQAGDLLRNPFCSLVKPTVNIRQYADLAYLCTCIKRDHIKDQAFAGYRGQANSMCARTEAELKQIATNMYRMAQEKTDTDMSIQALYKSRCGIEGADLHEIQDDVYIVPRPDAAAANLHLGDDHAEHHREARREAMEQLRQTRIGWPRQAMNLPVGAIRVTRDQMYEALERTASPEARAFKLIMSRLYALQNQVPLATMPGNAVNIPSPVRTIPEDVRDALILWGADIPVEWSLPTPVYIPGQIVGPYPRQFATILPRQSVNVPPPEINPPGLPQNPQGGGRQRQRQRPVPQDEARGGEPDEGEARGDNE